MVVKDTGSVGEVEPRVFRRLVLGEPLRPGRAARESSPQFLLAAYSLHAVGYPERDREPSQTFELLVRAQDENVDPRDHLRHHAIFDSGERLPTSS